MMRIWKCMLCTLVLAVILTGCGKRNFPMEDYVRENPQNDMGSIMKTETGFYYNAGPGQPLSLHYYDMESGQDIFLCSKPECQHDGNEFCTATNSQYVVNSTCLYGGRIYIAVVKAVDAQYSFQLLSAAPDGTELSEVVTYLAVNDTSMIPILGGMSRGMMIHRGKAVLSYQLRNKDNMDVGINGTVIYDLKTGEMDSLTEYTLEESMDGQNRFCGYGDYIYYNTLVGHKTTLSRYCLTDGSIEDLELEINYSGVYTVMDEDTIYYTRNSKKGSLYEYHHSTGKTIEHQKVFVREETFETVEGNLITAESMYEVSDLETDGNYLFAGEDVRMHHVNVEVLEKSVLVAGTFENSSILHVFDATLNEVTGVVMGTSQICGYRDWYTVNILDNEVYVRTPRSMYRCSMDSFLSGEPEYEELFSFAIQYGSLQN